MIEALHAMADSQNTTIKTLEYRIRPNKKFVQMAFFENLQFRQ
jgi:hypothetical protein